MKYVRYIVAAVLLILIVTGVSVQQAKSSETAYLLDTIIQVTAYGVGKSEAVRAAVSRIEEIDATFSAYREGSEIDKINSAPAGTPVQVSEEVYGLIRRANHFSELTGGAFDITVKPLVDLWGIGTDHARVPAPEEIQNTLAAVGYQYVELDDAARAVTLRKNGMGLDLGAIAKGYASDEAVRVLKEHGVKNAYLDLGGNIATIGGKPQALGEILTGKGLRRNFTVGIQNPDGARGEIAETVEMPLSGGVVVTSGDYERFFEQDGVRYHHILDPRTGYPARSGLRSATVVRENGAEADALATSVFILGREGAQITEDSSEVILLPEG